MKRMILIFSLLLGINASFMACRDKAEEKEDIVEDELETEQLNEGQESDSDFARYDADKDNRWDEREFRSSFNSKDKFSTWDSNRDSSLNTPEFYLTTFSKADLNNDERVSREEWSKGFQVTYGDYAHEDDFDLFDTDEDGFLSSEEWSDGFDDSEWFDDFDENDDDLISNDEWDKGIFQDWDENEDGYLDEEEFNNYYTGFENW